jgi:RNA polymerase-binding transcription factor DksA
MSEISSDSVAAIEATLIDVDRALDRLREGTYRECDSCGAQIDETLLMGDPLRTNCAAHPQLHH